MTKKGIDVSPEVVRSFDVERSRALNPALQTFGEWLQRSKAAIPL